MSSWKKAAKMSQKTHRERHQPEARKHLELLEKKKDYIIRTRDFQEKRATIKLLRKRALNKNPDEFHFYMINSKVVNGVHQELMETQDLRYVAYKRNIEAKKIDKLQSQLHMIDAANETQNQHIFFLDDDEMKNFNLVKKLDTHPGLLFRRTTRPSLKETHDLYKELEKRIDRERELTVVQQKLEVRRVLEDKSTSEMSVVSRHQVNEMHELDWDNVRILDTQQSLFKRRISEMVYIKNQISNINKQSDTEDLPNVYLPFLKKDLTLKNNSRTI
ncbi:UTP11 protein, partial [Pseudoatta argentina]